MLTRKTKLWIFISAASVILASAAAVVFTKPELFKSCTWKLSGGGCGGAPARRTVALPAPAPVAADVPATASGSSGKNVTFTNASTAITEFTRSEEKTVGTLVMYAISPDASTTRLNRLTVSLVCGGSPCTSTSLGSAGGNVTLEMDGRTETVSKYLRAAPSVHSVTFDTLARDTLFPFDIPTASDTPPDLRMTIKFTPALGFPKDMPIKLQITAPRTDTAFINGFTATNSSAYSIGTVRFLNPVPASIRDLPALQYLAPQIPGLPQSGEIVLRAPLPAPIPAPAPLTISNVEHYDVTQDSATVRWDTNRSSDSTVKYCFSTLVSSCRTQIGNEIEIGMKHNVSLEGLMPNTTYHYQVQSREAAGTIAMSPASTISINFWPTFKTQQAIIAEVDDTPPADIDRSEIHVRRSVDTPVAASFQPGAQGNVFKVRAFVPLGQPDAEIESIAFSKFGTTRNRDFDEIRLYEYEGDHRFEPGVKKVLGDIAGVQNGGYVNFQVNRILSAGKTATFTLWVKLKSDALIDSTFYFSVPHSDEVTPADNVDIVILEDRNGSRCVGDDPNCVRSENFVVAREEVAFVEPPPSCTLDTWSCGSWNACTLSGTQNRSCVKTFDCTTANTASPATSQSCTADEEPGPTLSGLTCEQQDLFTYTGQARPGRTPGMCIPCRTNLYVATGGTCDLDIGDEEPPAEEEQEPAPAPTLQSAPRIVQAPERSDSGPGVLVYFAAMGAANLAFYLKKRKGGKN